MLYYLSCYLQFDSSEISAKQGKTILCMPNPIGSGVSLLRMVLNIYIISRSAANYFNYKILITVFLLTFSLTVQKEGPNKGRPFYACPAPRGQGCNFFQWADEAGGGGGGFSSGGKIT